MASWIPCYSHGRCGLSKILPGHLLLTRSSAILYFGQYIVPATESYLIVPEIRRFESLLLELECGRLVLSICCCESCCKRKFPAYLAEMFHVFVEIRLVTIRWMILAVVVVR